MQHNVNDDRKKKIGVGTLIITVLILMMSVLVIIYSGNFGILQQKTAANQIRNNQAYSAAEAGLEYGIAYLSQNRSTISANPVNGFINYGSSDANITNVMLGNGGYYSITYTNPIANDFKLMQISSTGTSPDATATRTIQEDVLQRSLIVSGAITTPTKARGNISLKGDTAITNNTGGLSVLAGGIVDLQGNATTSVKNGGSDAKTLGTDILQNIPALYALDSNALFFSYFNANKDTIKSLATNVFTSSSQDLNGINGASIWIDTFYDKSSVADIGTIEQPVLIIVNGDLNLNGNITIYGFVYVDGNTLMQGSVHIIGGIVTTGDMTLQISAGIDYDTSVIDNLTNTAPSNYIKVPGTWRDFQ